MNPEYTRQRQGRDFSLHDALRNKLEETRRNDENAVRSEEESKTLAEKLKRFRKEAVRNAVPIDGDEPPEKRGITK